MDLTTVTIEAGNPAKPQNTVPVDFLVDSGAIYSCWHEPIVVHVWL